MSGLRFAPDGQSQFDIIEGSEHTLPADMVIFAIGQTPDLSGLAGDGGIETSKLGTIAAGAELPALPPPVRICGESAWTSALDKSLREVLAYGCQGVPGQESRMSGVPEKCQLSDMLPIDSSEEV